MAEEDSERHDERDALIAWLRAQISDNAAFSEPQKQFIREELKPNPSGPGFTASDEHVKGNNGSVFRNALKHPFSTLPPYQGKRLQRLTKPPKGDYLEFDWGHDRSSESHHDWSVLVTMDADYQTLVDIVKTTRVEKLTLIQHWGHSTANLRKTLLEQPVGNIELYLQNPELACCDKQIGRVSDYVADFLRAAEEPHNKKLFKERVKLFVFDEPASLRAILIDDKILAVGWYIYYPGHEPRREVDIMGREFTNPLRQEHLERVFGTEGRDRLLAKKRPAILSPAFPA